MDRKYVVAVSLVAAQEAYRRFGRAVLVTEEQRAEIEHMAEELGGTVRPFEVEQPA